MYYPKGKYAGYGKHREFFYSFDAFIRAKPNSDITCEDMIKTKEVSSNGD